MDSCANKSFQGMGVVAGMDVLCASSCFRNDASHQLFFFFFVSLSGRARANGKEVVCRLGLPLRAFFFNARHLFFSSSSPQKKKKKEHERERERERKSTQLSSPNMATDEELEAKKVNDTTTPTEDKAPEQPEKKKKDVATAILERKKAPNRLVVGEFFF